MWLEKILKISKRAFTGLVMGGIMAILLGAVLIIVAYVVMQAVLSGVLSAGGSTLAPSGASCALGACLGNGTINASLWATVGNVMQALSIGGVSLIIVGIAIIVAVLMGLAGGGGGGRR